MIAASESDGPPSNPPPPGETGLRKMAVAELLGAAKELILVHDGTEYRLRITSNGKLLLTK